MKRYFECLAFIVPLFVLVTSAAVASNLDLRPGEYSFTITYEIGGKAPNSSHTVPRCIAPSDLDSPEKIFNDRVSDRFRPDPSCVIKNLKLAGGRISYDAVCANRLTHVEGTINSTEFRATRDVKPKTGPGVLFRLELTGKRTGGCTAKGG